jgi:hypothetical protein
VDWEYDLPEPRLGDYVIYFYCDESGSAGNSEWVAVAGYRLSHFGIRPFNAQWSAFLRAHEIPPIHMREIFSGNPLPKKSNSWTGIRKSKGADWEQWRDQELDCFASWVKGSSEARSGIWPLVAMGCVVNADYFRGGRCKKIAKGFNEDAARFALQRTILHWMTMRISQGEDPEVGIVLDDNHEESLRFHKWVNEIKYGRDQAIGRNIKSLCFVDDIGYPLVQAADMLAYAARDRQQCLNDETTSELQPSIYEKLTNNRASEPEVLGPIELDALEALEAGGPGSDDLSKPQMRVPPGPRI